MPVLQEQNLTYYARSIKYKSCRNNIAFATQEVLSVSFVGIKKTGERTIYYLEICFSLDLRKLNKFTIEK